MKAGKWNFPLVCVGLSAEVGLFLPPFGSIQAAAPCFQRGAAMLLGGGTKESPRVSSLCRARRDNRARVARLGNTGRGHALAEGPRAPEVGYPGEHLTTELIQSLHSPRREFLAAKRGLPWSWQGKLQGSCADTCVSSR